MFRVRTEEKLSGAGRGEASDQQLSTGAALEATRRIERDQRYRRARDLDGALRRGGAQEAVAKQRGGDVPTRPGTTQQSATEHAELLDTLKQCKRRRKERVRIQGMLRGPQAEEVDYDSDGRSSSSGNSRDSDHSSSREHRRRSSSGSRHHRSRKDGAKKGVRGCGASRATCRCGSSFCSPSVAAPTCRWRGRWRTCVASMPTRASLATR